MKNKLITIFLLFSIFIPIVNAENETLLITENNQTNESLINETLDNTDNYVDYGYDTDNYLDKMTGSNKYEEQYNGYTILIEDDANLIDSDRISDLVEDMRPLTKYGNVVFKTTDTNRMSVETFALSYLGSKFGNANGSVFVIDMYNRKIAIASKGDNQRYLTNAKSDIITSNVYRNATYGDYYTCAKKAFEQMYTVLDGGTINEPMRYISNVVLSLVAAFFIGFFRILSTSKIRKADPSEILSDCDIKFSVENVQGIKTGTHKVYDPPSDSGGGGSSGGGGGGGGGGGSSGSHGF
jgi:uncharacterized protein